MNQSTASSTAYPIPIEKVKNGYDYIIRGEGKKKKKKGVYKNNSFLKREMNVLFKKISQ